MKKVSLIFILIASHLSFASNSVAEESSKTSYTIGVQEFSYYPHYYGENMDFIGYSRDLLDAFAATQDYDLIYKTMPYRRLVHQFLNNKVDLQYPDNDYWQTELKQDKGVIYSDDAVHYIDGLHVLPENKGKGIESIKSIGTLIGFSPIQYLPLEKEGSLTISYDATVAGLIKQVHLKRLDAIYLNVDVVRHLEQGKVDALIFDDSLPFVESGYKISTIKHQKVVEDFNRFLIEQKTTVDALKTKYNLLRK